MQVRPYTTPDTHSLIVRHPVTSQYRMFGVHRLHRLIYRRGSTSWAGSVIYQRLSVLRDIIRTYRPRPDVAGRPVQREASNQGHERAEGASWSQPVQPPAFPQWGGRVWSSGPLRHNHYPASWLSTSTHLRPPLKTNLWGMSIKYPQSAAWQCVCLRTNARVCVYECVKAYWPYLALANRKKKSIFSFISLFSSVWYE